VRIPLIPLAGALLAVGLPLGATLASCGTDAVGVEACRQIETTRCESLVSCPADQGGFAGQEQITACSLYYRDQCLLGIESTVEPSEAQVTACVDAVKATAACAKAGAPSMNGCAGAPLIASADPTAVSPCRMIVEKVELLAACSFVASAAPDGGAADTGTDGDAASD